MPSPFHPILSCSQAAQFEAELLQECPQKTWQAMQKVGQACAQAILADIREITPQHNIPLELRILILAGKGHNGGDALLTAHAIHQQIPHCHIDIISLCPLAANKTLWQKAFHLLEPHATRHLTLCADTAIENWIQEHYHLCLDGLLGMSYQPPLREPIPALLSTINQHPHIDFRVAIDLPSGIDSSDSSVPLAFQAHSTYATGILKEPAIQRQHQPWVGRLRYLDIGFFDSPSQPAPPSPQQVASPQVTDFLQQWRPVASYKKTQGHLLIIGGSQYTPGALLMSAQAALRSGLGLVTAACPARFVAAFAAQHPEIMWLPLPETENGHIALEAFSQLKAYTSKVDACLIGPGLGREAETHSLIHDLLGQCPLPCILDADILQAALLPILQQRQQKQLPPSVCTPHLGEYRRLFAEEPDHSRLRQHCQDHGILLVCKQELTRISDAQHTVYCPHGGPVLARGGSGDLLAGLIAGRITVTRQANLPTVSQAVVWHSQAADRLAQTQGAEAIAITQLLHHL